MSAWWTTEAVLQHLQISRDALMVLAAAPSEQPAAVLYAGRAGAKSARYRWRADRVDDWFEEASRWRASRNEATGGSSDGGTEAEEPEPTRSPSRPSGTRSGSRSRSKTRSTGTDGTNLVELARRLTSR